MSSVFAALSLWFEHFFFGGDGRCLGFQAVSFQGLFLLRGVVFVLGGVRLVVFFCGLSHGLCSWSVAFMNTKRYVSGTINCQQATWGETYVHRPPFCRDVRLTMFDVMQGSGFLWRGRRGLKRWVRVPEGGSTVNT